MNSQADNRGKSILIAIMVVSFILPIPYFIVIQVLQIGGLAAYFLQLGLYLLLYGIAIWGLKSTEISLPIGSRLALKAVGLAVASWLLYVGFLQLLGVINLASELRAIAGTAPGTILLRVLMTWFAVGTGEEILFRGYLLPAMQRFFTAGSARRRTAVAVLLSSVFFSLWHLPIRTVWLLSGEIGIGQLLLSLLIVLVEGIAFAHLYIRTRNILLVGLIHGLVDLPIIGGGTQLSAILLIIAIAIVEIALFLTRERTHESMHSTA